MAIGGKSGCTPMGDPGGEGILLRRRNLRGAIRAGSCTDGKPGFAERADPHQRTATPAQPRPHDDAAATNSGTYPSSQRRVRPGRSQPQGGGQPRVPRSPVSPTERNRLAAHRHPGTLLRLYPLPDHAQPFASRPPSIFFSDYTQSGSSSNCNLSLATPPQPESDLHRHRQPDSHRRQADPQQYDLDRLVRARS